MKTFEEIWELNNSCGYDETSAIHEAWKQDCKLHFEAGQRSRDDEVGILKRKLKDSEVANKQLVREIYQSAADAKEGYILTEKQTALRCAKILSGIHVDEYGNGQIADGINAIKEEFKCQ